MTIHSCRHVSRCLLIKFPLPELGDEQTEGELTAWHDLEETWEASSSCVGYLVSLGDMLEREGFEEIMATFVPKLQLLLQGVQPHVIPGYATLMWFTSKVILFVDAVVNS